MIHGAPLRTNGVTMNKRFPAILIAAMATALVSSCGSDDTAAPSPPNAAASVLDTAGQMTPASPAVTPASPPPEPVTPASPPPASPPPEQCLDADSQIVEAALASLSPSPGGGWVAGRYSEAPAGSCPDLEYVLAETPGGTVSSPTHVLFFHDGTYLGTATSEAYAYTTVSAASENSVSVDYRWLAPADANCCPSGGPATIPYTWDGSRVVMGKPLPQAMLDSYDK